MRYICLVVAILAGIVTGCEVPPEYLSATQISQTVQASIATVEAAARTPSVTGTATGTASATSAIRTPSATPTVSFTPTTTRTPTVTPTPTLTPTSTRTPTSTPTPTFTPLPPKISTAILGCKGGIDVTHGLGEVTNAYVRARNLGGSELTNVCLTLSANDEGKVHPDKTHCIASLPINYEVTVKLTVDTAYGKLTSIAVAAATSQGATDKVSGPGCAALSDSQVNQITLDAPRPIQGP